MKVMFTNLILIQGGSIAAKDVSFIKFGKILHTVGNKIKKAKNNNFQVKSKEK